MSKYLAVIVVLSFTLIGCFLVTFSSLHRFCTIHGYDAYSWQDGCCLSSKGFSEPLYFTTHNLTWADRLQGTFATPDTILRYCVSQGYSAYSLPDNHCISHPFLGSLKVRRRDVQIWLRDQRLSMLPPTVVPKPTATATPLPTTKPPASNQQRSLEFLWPLTGIPVAIIAYWILAYRPRKTQQPKIKIQTLVVGDVIVYGPPKHTKDYYCHLNTESPVLHKHEVNLEDF